MEPGPHKYPDDIVPYLPRDLSAIVASFASDPPLMSYRRAVVHNWGEEIPSENELCRILEENKVKVPIGDLMLGGAMCIMGKDRWWPLGLDEIVLPDEFLYPAFPLNYWEEIVPTSNIDGIWLETQAHTGIIVRKNKKEKHSEMMPAYALRLNEKVIYLAYREWCPLFTVNWYDKSFSCIEGQVYVNYQMLAAELGTIAQ